MTRNNLYRLDVDFPLGVSVVTLPTDDLVVGDPRCCCKATAGGNPSTESTFGTAIW